MQLLDYTKCVQYSLDGIPLIYSSDDGPSHALTTTIASCSIFCMIVHHVINTRQKCSVIQSERQSVNRQQSERENTDQILHGPSNRS